VSQYQKGKTSLDFTGARDSEWQWHQLGHMHVCISLQTDNHASTPPLTFLQAGCPTCCPTNSVKALKAIVAVDNTHPFNGPMSGTTRVSRYQKGKTNLDCTEARDSEWQWHQLGTCKSAPRSRQPCQHLTTQFFTGRMPFLPPNQQRQSTEGTVAVDK